MTLETTTATPKACLSTVDRSQHISIWKWNGFDWKCLCSLDRFWHAEINLSGLTLAFPVGFNPNTFSEYLYSEYVQPETPEAYPLEQPTAKPTGARLEFYADLKDKNAVICYSFKPKRVAPVAYRVKRFWDGVNNPIYSCTCPAHQYYPGKTCKHVTAAKTIDFSTLTREPIEVVPDRHITVGNAHWNVWYGIAQGQSNCHYLGRVRASSLSDAKQKGNLLADVAFKHHRLFLP